MKTSYTYVKEIMQGVRPESSYKGIDFEKWKAESREKLTKLIGLDRFEKVSPATETEFVREIENANETRFTFETEKGYRVPCHLLVPKGTAKPPVIICVQGHSPGMHISLNRPKNEQEKNYILTDDGDYAIRAVKEGFATVTLEQRNFGEMGGTYCMPEAMTNLLMGRTTIGERVWDICRLIDVIESEFGSLVDVNCISLMGHSGGGTATAYTAALEDRLVLALSSCAMASFRDSIGAIEHCPCNYVPGIANVFDMGDLMAMACPKYFVQVSGVNDDIFPVSAAKRVFEEGALAYGSMGLSGKCRLYLGEGGHRFYADGSWNIIHELLKK